MEVLDYIDYIDYYLQINSYIYHFYMYHCIINKREIITVYINIFAKSRILLWQFRNIYKHINININIYKTDKFWQEIV